MNCVDSVLKIYIYFQNESCKLHRKNRKTKFALLHVKVYKLKFMAQIQTFLPRNLSVYELQLSRKVQNGTSRGLSMIPAPNTLRNFTIIAQSVF